MRDPLAPRSATDFHTPIPITFTYGALAVALELPLVVLLGIGGGALGIAAVAVYLKRRAETRALASAEGPQQPTPAVERKGLLKLGAKPSAMQGLDFFCAS